MVLTETGLSKVFQRIKSFVISQLNSKASAIHTHTSSDITDLPNGYVVDSTLDGTSSNAIANSAVSNALDECVPKAGGAVMSGQLYKDNNNELLIIAGGTDWSNSGSITLFGGNNSETSNRGVVRIMPHNGGTISTMMQMYPNGTWTWSGQAVQLVSDQRLKQQINQIDDKLLDAWEDVELCQFKYNDAVKEKSDNARLHTGYVVQQIDTACKSHGVDVSQYGLYCHEEYPEETEEVEVEQADGTKVKERKVIREASEHYSLRYTEVYAVECMYLRRENSRLKEKLASLEERLEKLEKAENQEK